MVSQPMDELLGAPHRHPVYHKFGSRIWHRIRRIQWSNHCHGYRRLRPPKCCRSGRSDKFIPTAGNTTVGSGGHQTPGSPIDYWGLGSIGNHGFGSPQIIIFLNTELHHRLLDA